MLGNSNRANDDQREHPSDSGPTSEQSFVTAPDLESVRSRSNLGIERQCTITAIDMKSDGEKEILGSVPTAMKSEFIEQLRPLTQSSTIRILLVDSPAITQKGGETALKTCSSTSYSSGCSECSRASRYHSLPCFDLWDLQYVFEPTVDTPPRHLSSCHFIHERDTHEHLPNSQLIDIVYTHGPFRIRKCCSSVQSELLPEGNVQVTIEFPILMAEEEACADYLSIDGANADTPAPGGLSLLKRHFWDIFYSKDSATLIPGASSVKMVMIDFLRAVIESWKVITLQLQEALWLLREERKWEFPIRQNNIARVTSISKILRQINLALNYSRKSALKTPEIPGHEAMSKTRLDEISVDADMKLQALEQRFGDILWELNTQFNERMIFEQQVQAGNVNLLTVLATIFLPFSLASSFLGMSTRAAGLGMIWYDFAGLSFLLVLVASAFYQIKGTSDIVKMTKVLFGYLGRPQNGSQGYTLNPVLVGWLRILWKIPGLGWKLARSLVLVSFWITVAVSFFIGMFGELSQALGILEYGTAGWGSAYTLLLLTQLLLRLSRSRWIRRV